MRPLIRTSVCVTLIVLSTAARLSAQTDDPQLRTDIDKLMTVTGAASLGAQMASMVSSAAIDNMRRSNPAVPEGAIALIKEVLDTEFSRAFDAPDGLRGDLINIYASHFTHEEVLALLRFYDTPVGRKMIDLMPTLGRESAQAGERWAAANTNRISALVQQRLRDEGFIK